MSAPKRCADCTHTVGQHSHIVPHPCKADGCNCESYAREPINLINQEGKSNG